MHEVHCDETLFNCSEFVNFARIFMKFMKFSAENGIIDLAFATAGTDIALSLVKHFNLL